MGRTTMGRARSGVAGVICLLALGHAAEAQKPSGAPRHALTYDQAFGTSAFGGREQPAVLADVPTIGCLGRDRARRGVPRRAAG